MKSPSLRMNVNGDMCEYNPKPDITAYEVALLHKLITIACSVPISPEDKNAFINEHNLARHFDRELNK